MMHKDFCSFLMSTLMRKTARIFASDPGLDFGTWQNVLLRKAFRIELSNPPMVRDAANTWCAGLLPAREGRMGRVLWAGPT